MPKFKVQGEHHLTGKRQALIYEAEDESQAEKLGWDDGLIVEKIQLIKNEPLVEHPTFFSKLFKEYKKSVSTEKKCKYCAMMVPRDAKICPHCRKKLRVPQPLWVWISIIGFVILVSFFSGKKEDETTQNKQSPQQVTREVKQPVAPRSATNETIYESEYGKHWPFTVSYGQLACSGAGAITFTAHGKTYAVNGLATSDNKYSNIREIWKDDSETEHAKYMRKQGRPDLVPKISIGPIIDRGLKLCK